MTSASVHWLIDTARARARRLEVLRFGFAVLDERFPRAHDHNRLLVTGPATGPEIVAAAERILGDAGLEHRLIEVYDSTVAAAVTASLTDAGYAVTGNVVMDHRARVPWDPRVAIESVELHERATLGSASWLDHEPPMDAETIRQFGDRISTIGAVAETEFLVARDPEGAVIGHVDLYWRDRILQIEELWTDPPARGHGVGRALIEHAVCRAVDLDNALVFLVADADDWPRGFYRRLGFAEQAAITSFARA
jgi:ribosomal protein S18 acetylase RimI-like enzyme